MYALVTLFNGSLNCSICNHPKQPSQRIFTPLSTLKKLLYATSINHPTYCMTLKEKSVNGSEMLYSQASPTRIGPCMPFACHAAFVQMQRNLLTWIFPTQAQWRSMHAHFGSKSRPSQRAPCSPRLCHSDKTWKCRPWRCKRSRCC